MIATVILRFRDLVADTIVEHRKLLDETGEVWWGWWRKGDEPKRLHELRELRAKTAKSPIDIGLCDRSQSRFFTAKLSECSFDDDGEPIPSPDINRTPKYYRSKAFPAWFKLVGIRGISQEEFIKEFSEVPTEDYTFIPIFEDNGKGWREKSEIRSDAIPLHGDSIVHISDLHFGSDFGFPDIAAPGSFPLMDILEKDIRQVTEGKHVGLLVVSGDTTSRGDATYLMNVAVPFLTELQSKLGLDPEHVIIVPGNHDIPLQKFNLKYPQETAFNNFLEKFYGSKRKPIELLKYVLPSGRLVEVLPINSVKLRKQETSNYGWVDWRAYDALLGRTSAERGTLRIAVLHHHLVPTLREERLPDSDDPNASASVTLNAAAIIEGLQQHGFRIVLHGHHHTPALNRISRGRRKEGTFELEGQEDPLYIIAAGSAGVMASRLDGEIRDNSYGILTIEDKRIRLTARQFNPSGDPRELFWAPLAIPSWEAGGSAASLGQADKIQLPDGSGK